MKEIRYRIKLDKYEHGVLITALYNKRCRLVQQNENTELIDNLLLRILHLFD